MGAPTAHPVHSCRACPYGAASPFERAHAKAVVASRAANAPPVGHVPRPQGVYAGHEEFGGRVVPGWSAGCATGMEMGCGTKWLHQAILPAGTQCDSHGTHTASTAAGRRYGVAKEATIVAVQGLDCTGEATDSKFISALEWSVSAAPAARTGTGGRACERDSPVLTGVVRRREARADGRRARMGGAGVDAEALGTARHAARRPWATAVPRGAAFGGRRD